jgi:hypothetical protein
LLAVARFCYRDWVEAVQDYQAIPVIRTLERHHTQAHREVTQWQQQGRFVADFDLKMPDYPQGSTALDTVRDQIVEPLRLECAPRAASGHWRRSTGVAGSLQIFLMWVFLTLFPARRQQEYRSMRVALSCPIQPPEEVPQGGGFFRCRRLNSATAISGETLLTIIYTGRTTTRGGTTQTGFGSWR